MKLRTVIDTNILISSFFGGNPREIIRLWKRGKIIWCLSRPILDEYFRVLKRLNFHRSPRFHELLHLFFGGYNMAFLAYPPELDVHISDPEDKKFIECAVALKAPYIISGDKHLLDLESYGEIKILTPKDFLEKVSVEEGFNRNG